MNALKHVVDYGDSISKTNTVNLQAKILWFLVFYPPQAVLRRLYAAACLLVTGGR